MANCKKCSTPIPSTITIDGKYHNLQSRKHCLTCIPFQSHLRLSSLNGKRRGPLPIGLCVRCNRSKPIRSRQMCMACVVSVRRTNLKIRAVLYKGNACERCGYNGCLESMTFHHRDAAHKDFEISGATWNWALLTQELDKCEMLCQNCHHETHSKTTALYWKGVVAVAVLEPACLAFQTSTSPLMFHSRK